eukprot:3861053-Rhodomonas_salina.2
MRPLTAALPMSFSMAVSSRRCSSALTCLAFLAERGRVLRAPHPRRCHQVPGFLSAQPPHKLSNARSPHALQCSNALLLSALTYAMLATDPRSAMLETDLSSSLSSTVQKAHALPPPHAGTFLVSSPCPASLASVVLRVRRGIEGRADRCPRHCGCRCYPPAPRPLCVAVAVRGRRMRADGGAQGRPRTQAPGLCRLAVCFKGRDVVVDEFAQSPPSGIRAGDDVQGRFQGALSSSPSHSLCATSGSPCTVWSSVQVSATRRNVWL